MVKCLAGGGDPRSAKAGNLAEGKPVTIGTDDSIEEAIRDDRLLLFRLSPPLRAGVPPGGGRRTGL